jgi:hypothetical protein
MALQVSWNASGRVNMWVATNTLVGNLDTNFIVTTRTSNQMAITATSGVYWVIFAAEDGDFVNGGYIWFDIRYPGGLSAVTYFEQVSLYVH